MCCRECSSQRLTTFFKVTAGCLSTNQYRTKLQPEGNYGEIFNVFVYCQHDDRQKGFFYREGMWLTILNYV